MILLVAITAVAAPWGPWDDAWPPVGQVRATPQQAPPRGGLFEAAYRFYRRASRPGTATCPFYPTCSAYGVLAVREHGALLGGLYTVDRLLYREHPWLVRTDTYPLVTPHDRPRFHDPVPARRP